MKGIIAVDKPIGYSSNQVVQIVKRCYQSQKAGHGGALDVMATGVLPILIGEATKFSHWSLHADKTYQVHAKLGERTATGDAEGDVIQSRCEQLDKLDHSDIKGVIESFQGESEQIPSMYSAIKHQGKPLYRFARQGKEVERPSRTIFVAWIKILDLQKDQFVIEVACSKGTYIRNLIDDIGEQLGCGAYVAQLRRIAVGDLSIASAVSLEALQQSELARQSYLMPIDTCLKDYPAVELNDEQVKRLQYGQQVVVQNVLPEVDALVRVYRRNKGDFLGLAIVQALQTLKAKRLLAY